MIDDIELYNGRILVHLAEISLKSTKSFTHGGVRFDTSAGTVTFGSLPPVSFPGDIAIADGKTLDFLFAGPDGKLKKQTRTSTLSAVKGSGVFRIPGRSKTPARFTTTDGWSTEVYKYRAYYTHPGLATTGEIPAWLRRWGE